MATVQPITRLERAVRQGEHEGLQHIHGLSMQADDLKIDLFGSVAMAAFILNDSFTALKN